MCIKLLKTKIYTPKNNLEKANTLIYKRELTITLVYKYKVNSVGKFKNKKELIKVY